MRQCADYSTLWGWDVSYCTLPQADATTTLHIDPRVVITVWAAHEEPLPTGVCVYVNLSTHSYVTLAPVDFIEASLPSLSPDFSRVERFQFRLTPRSLLLLQLCINGLSSFVRALDHDYGVVSSRRWLARSAREMSVESPSILLVELIQFTQTLSNNLPALQPLSNFILCWITTIKIDRQILQRALEYPARMRLTVLVASASSTPFPIAARSALERVKLYLSLGSASLTKLDKAKTTGAEGGKSSSKLNIVDNKIIDIIGRDTAVIDGLPILETPRPDSRKYSWTFRNSKSLSWKYFWSFRNSKSLSRKRKGCEDSIQQKTIQKWASSQPFPASRARSSVAKKRAYPISGGPQETKSRRYASDKPRASTNKSKKIDFRGRGKYEQRKHRK
ncbi:hypothetical protein WDU94_015511 [Cyamophila willieti]